jgi:hypothetical protein
MFTEETIGRDVVREPALSTLDADFAVHATAIEELYHRMLSEIAEAARAWTPEVARLEAQQSVPTPRRPTRAESRSEGRVELPTQAITAPRVEPRTEAITAPRTDVVAAQQHAPVRTRGAHHAETGQMARITVRPDVPRGAAA